MMRKPLIVAVAIALSSSAACAADKNTFTKEEGIGVLTGATAGALVGGPVGAAVGFMVGGIVGDNIGAAKRANVRVQELERELLEARIELARVSERIGGDTMFDELAQRLHTDVLFRTGRASGARSASGSEACRAWPIAGLISWDPDRAARVCRSTRRRRDELGAVAASRGSGPRSLARRRRRTRANRVVCARRSFVYRA